MSSASPLELLVPDVRRPCWREPSGERTTFQEVVLGLDNQAARQVAERHAEAIWALRQRAHEDARRRAHAAGRLCDEVAGFWPHDSWKPIR